MPEYDLKKTVNPGAWFDDHFGIGGQEASALLSIPWSDILEAAKLPDGTMDPAAFAEIDDMAVQGAQDNLPIGETLWNIYTVNLKGLFETWVLDPFTGKIGGDDTARQEAIRKQDLARRMATPDFWEKTALRVGDSNFISDFSDHYISGATGDFPAAEDIYGDYWYEKIQDFMVTQGADVIASLPERLTNKDNWYNREGEFEQFSVNEINAKITDRVYNDDGTVTYTTEEGIKATIKMAAGEILKRIDADGGYTLETEGVEGFDAFQSYNPDGTIPAGSESATSKPFEGVTSDMIEWATKWGLDAANAGLKYPGEGNWDQNSMDTTPVVEVPPDVVPEDTIGDVLTGEQTNDSGQRNPLFGVTQDRWDYLNAGFTTAYPGEGNWDPADAPAQPEPVVEEPVVTEPVVEEPVVEDPDVPFPDDVPGTTPGEIDNYGNVIPDEAVSQNQFGNWEDADGNEIPRGTTGKNADGSWLDAAGEPIPDGAVQQDNRGRWVTRTGQFVEGVIIPTTLPPTTTPPADVTGIEHQFPNGDVIGVGTDETGPYFEIPLPGTTTQVKIRLPGTDVSLPSWEDIKSIWDDIFGEGGPVQTQTGQTVPVPEGEPTTGPASGTGGEDPGVEEGTTIELPWPLGGSDDPGTVPVEPPVETPVEPPEVDIPFPEEEEPPVVDAGTNPEIPDDIGTQPGEIPDQGEPPVTEEPVVDVPFPDDEVEVPEEPIPGVDIPFPEAPTDNPPEPPEVDVPVPEVPQLDINFADNVEALFANRKPNAPTPGQQVKPPNFQAELNAKLLSNLGIGKVADTIGPALSFNQKSGEANFLKGLHPKIGELLSAPRRLTPRTDGVGQGLLSPQNSRLV
jgi:hypothetical protein